MRARTAQTERWTVSHWPMEAVEREFASLRPDGSRWYDDDKFDAALQCEECRSFPTEALAVAWARTKAAGSFHGVAQVQFERWDPYCRTWDPVGNIIEIEPPQTTEGTAP